MKTWKSGSFIVVAMLLIGLLCISVAVKQYAKHAPQVVLKTGDTFMVRLYRASPVNVRNNCVVASAEHPSVMLVAGDVHFDQPPRVQVRVLREDGYFFMAEVLTAPHGLKEGEMCIEGDTVYVPKHIAWKSRREKWQ